jgi:hypothetical protein
MRRLKQLEDENSKLKRMVADLSLDKEMLQDRAGCLLPFLTRRDWGQTISPLSRARWHRALIPVTA